ncbi:ABC transporter permease [Mesoterricola silvestris]|uniref:ABC transporter permease n=1 Tax=Mesoterricola silvestris TaxID=2927979 RepID=A0AA48HAU3_9BACT|nr:ABC transporter permease [Mesoterricola silvestris]BDU74913.1 ABC transporter permease [Mesoterricola silvestris]
MTHDLVYNILSLGVPFSVALLLASLGEMFNQRAGVFNLGCEGIMCMGAFLGFLPAFFLKTGPLAPYGIVLGFAVAAAAGVVLGLLFALVTVTFRAEQGIAGIGLQMLGWGVAGTLFRHFIGGVTGVEGLAAWSIPGLSRIPFLGGILFNHNPMVYVAFLMVPASWYVLFKTPWGLKVRAAGTEPRAADSMGINVNRVRYQALMLGGAMAGLGGAYLSLCQAKMFADDLVAGRGFIAVALVYFGRWSPLGVLGGALLFSLAQSLQLAIQVAGIKFPYEFAVMLPYVLVILVLSLARKARMRGPTHLGVPFNREMRY